MLYVQLNDDLVFEVEWAVDQESQQQIQALHDQMKLLQNKRIAIPLEQGQWGTVALNPQVVQSLLSHIQSVPIFTSYYELDWTLYWWINPLVCNEDMFRGWIDCLAMRQESYTQSQGKWFIFFEENLGVYSIGITDRFTKEKMPTEMQIINGKQLITWDDKNLLIVAVPLDQFGHISYKQGYLDLLLTIPGIEYAASIDDRIQTNQTVTVLWTLTTERVSIRWNMDFTDFWATLTVDATEEHDLAEWTIHFTIEPKNSQYIPQILVDMHYNSSLTKVEPVVVTAPDTWDTVALESLFFDQF